MNHKPNTVTQEIHKTKMKKLAIFFIPLFIIARNAEAQLPSNTSGYGCNAASAGQYPCEAYLLYRAHLPDYLDLAAVGDLFALSRLAIAVPSNISDPSAPLSPGQPLFVPVTCNCNAVNRSTSLSYANFSYSIKPDDTFYVVSTTDFQNLTTYQSVMLVNPKLVPTNLSLGDSVVFPVFCRCPDPTITPAKYLVSYLLRPSDTIASVAAFFGVSVRSILDVNGENPIVSDTVFVPVTRLPRITQPVVVASSPSPPPPVNSVPENDDEKGVVLGLAVGLGITSFLLLLLCFAWIYRERTAKREKKRTTMGRNSNRVLFSEIANDKYARDTTKKEMEESLMADVSGCLDKYKVFGIDEIVEATDGFHENCLVMGSVYKGVVDGQVLAIKKMNWDACEELKILQKVNHGNLVKLEGFCIDPANAECYLIYEFVEKGSLDSWLHGGESLRWKTRVRIAVDVANGLQYIHEHTRPRVVHKDIKSSNILLDANMRAKIANFGLAKSGCNAITTHIVGTQGYIAPEYLRDGVVSTKTDVFSFGVVLLELVSGREVVDERGHVLWANAGELMEGISDNRERAKRVVGFADRSLIEESCSIESLMSVMALALACTHKDPSKRPSMVDIVYALCKSDDSFSDFSGETFTGSDVMAR